MFSSFMSLLYVSLYDGWLEGDVSRTARCAFVSTATVDTSRDDRERRGGHTGTYKSSAPIINSRKQILGSRGAERYDTAEERPIAHR